MTLGKHNRILILILFIVSVLAVIFMAKSFWDQGIQKEISFNFVPLFYLIIALACISYIFVYIRKISNPILLENIVREEVEMARAKILSEFESKEEEVINKTVDIDERLDRIIPKGKFKTTESFASKLLVNMSSELQASLGMVYLAKGKNYSFLTGFALTGDEVPPDFKPGENLNGQVAKTKEVLVIQDIPEDYFSIESGLGKSKPKTLMIVPILHNNTPVGIIEIATFIKDELGGMLELLQKVGVAAGEKIVQIQKS